MVKGDRRMPKFIPVGKEDPMSTLCRMVAQREYEDLPRNVVNFAKRFILDTIGVTIGSSSSSSRLLPVVCG